MILANNRPAISVDLLKIEARTPDKLLTELPSPAMQLAKKRLSKLSNRKTNEQIIKQSHDELMNYVDNVESKVQGIIQTYEAEFLQAYLQHMKKVREEMEDIKKKSLSSANSQRTYIDKIDALEKQLVIFRDDSLQSYEKIMKKDKEIAILNSQLKQLRNEVKLKENTIYQLTRKLKEYDAAIENAKIAGNLDGKAIIPAAQMRNIRSQNKNYREMYSPMAKNLFLDRDISRPLSTQIKNQSKEISLQLSSRQKAESNKEDLKWIKEQIEKKVGDSQTIQVRTVLDLIAEKSSIDQQAKPQRSEFRKARSNYMARMQSKRSRQSIIDVESIQQRSKKSAEDNELRQIFMSCVQQVKKEIARRNKIPSLNFFKQNGPQGYLELKKIDCFMLMQSLFSREEVLKKVYELFFND